MKRPFRLRGSKKKAEKEKKGGAAVGSGSAGSSEFASQIASTISTASPASISSTGWSSAVSMISRATGLTGAAASKAGIAAIILGISAVVGTISLFVGSSNSSSRPRLGGRLFSAAGVDRVVLDRAERTNLPLRSADAVSEGSSLDYLRGSNSGNDGSLDNIADTDDLGASDSPAPTPEPVEVVTAARPPKEVQEKSPVGPKPKLTPGRNLAGGDSGFESKVTLAKLKDVAGGGEGGFQQIYKAKKVSDEPAQKRPSYGARGSRALNSGGNAIAQAKFANQMSRTGTRMGSAVGASAYESAPFDGGTTLGGSSDIDGGGDAIGGAGAQIGANKSRDAASRTLPPPPKDVEDAENKTPYQGLLLAATAALMIGMILLKMAGKMINEAKKSPGPDAAAKLAAGQALAMAAMAAGGAAAGIGAMLAGQYDQMAQSIPFILGGGALSVEAGMVLAKSEQAGEDAETGITEAAQQAGQMAQQAIGPQNDKVDDKKLEDDDKADQPVDVNRGSFGGRDGAFKQNPTNQ